MRAFWAALAACLLATVAFPLWQALDTGGLVYYMSAFDESTYLQYHFSKAIQGPTRPGQYLVTLGHEVGLSGGWLNALFDAAAIAGCALLARACFQRAGLAAGPAGLAALTLMLAPALAGTANPLVAWIHDRTMESALVSWLNVPEMYVSPLVRTPEPQVSLALLAAGALAGLALGAAWPVFPVLPLLYPFVGLPAGFVALALLLRAHWRWPRATTAGPLLAAALAIGMAAWAYYNVAIGENIRAVMIDSHLPLVSLTGLLALGARVALAGMIEERFRFFTWAVATAPWVASNQQLLSGHIPQPNNFEHYFGVFCFALILALALHARPRWATAVMLVSLVLFGRTSYVAFRHAQLAHEAFKPGPELLQALRESPEQVVVRDGMLSAMLSMVHPRGGSTALGFEQTYGGMADRNLERWRCVRARIRADRPADAKLAELVRWIDDGYMYGSQNVLVSHIKRKATFRKLRDPDAGACQGPPPKLRYFGP